jgi:hypothetical protein
MVHFRSKALDRTILKIWIFQLVPEAAYRFESGPGTHTFCTLMLWLVLLKIKAARMAFANLRAYDL